MFPLVEVKGNSYECGFQYGSAVAELVQSNIDIYQRLIHYHTGKSYEGIENFVKKEIEIINDYNPKLIEEMQGVADGSGVNLEEIAMLNCRTELLSQVGMQECTAFSITPPASKNDKVWIGQNWDWLSATKGKTVLLKIKQDELPEIIMLVEAGQIGKMGFNSAGIGLCHNALDFPDTRYGIPFLILCRIVLNQMQINNALNSISQLNRASSGNFIVSHSDGFSLDFEFTPSDYEYFEPHNGILVHTNHFLSKSFKSLDLGIRNNGWDSVIRRQRALYMLSSVYGGVDLDLIMKMQKDEKFGNSSIFVNSIESEHWAEQWCTLASIIINLSELRMYYYYPDHDVKNQYHQIGF